MRRSARDKCASSSCVSAPPPPTRRVPPTSRVERAGDAADQRADRARRRADARADEHAGDSAGRFAQLVAVLWPANRARRARRPSRARCVRPSNRRSLRSLMRLLRVDVRCMQGARTRPRRSTTLDSTRRIRADSMTWPRRSESEHKAGTTTRGWARSIRSGTRPADFLTVYARAFDTVEVDSTFYAIPGAKTVRGWAQRTPDDFMFSLKLPQEITHERRLRNADDARRRILRPRARARPQARADPHPARTRLRARRAAGRRALSAEAAARHPLRDRVPPARMDSRRPARAARRAQRRARAERRPLDSAQADDGARRAPDGRISSTFA